MNGARRPGGRAVLWWGLWLLWCAVIFFITANPVFTGESTAQALQRAVPPPVASHPNLVPLLNLFLRKSGHALGFGILGILSWQALAHWPRPRRLGLWAWLMATLYAATDEWHQTLVPGRTAQAWDVLLDSAGAALAILLLQRLPPRFSGPGRASR